MLDCSAPPYWLCSRGLTRAEVLMDRILVVGDSEALRLAPTTILEDAATT